MNLATYLRAIPTQIPEGIGRVHRVMGDITPKPTWKGLVSDQMVLDAIARHDGLVSTIDVAEELGAGVRLVQARIGVMLRQKKLYKTGRKGSYCYGVVR